MSDYTICAVVLVLLLLNNFTDNVLKCVPTHILNFLLWQFTIKLIIFETKRNFSFKIYQIRVKLQFYVEVRMYLRVGNRRGILHIDCGKLNRQRG